MEKNAFKLSWISNHWVVFFICFYAACPLWGQADMKRDVTPSDYVLWHTMMNFHLSDGGNWAAFHLSYDTTDTLVLQNTVNLTKKYIPNAFKETFLGGEKYFVYLDKNGLTKLGLNDCKREHFPAVVDYTISGNQIYWALQKREVNTKGEISQILEVGEFDGKTSILIENVEEYEFNKAGDLLAFVQKKDSHYILGVIGLDSGTYQTKHLKRSEFPITKFVWGIANNLSFLEAIGPQNNTVNWIEDVLNKPQLHTYNNHNKINGKDFQIINTVGTTLHFSDNGEKLFFHFQHKEEKSNQKIEDTIVQVWNTKDRLIYPSRMAYGDYYKSPKMLAVWKLQNNTLLPLGTKKSPNAVWGNKDKYIYTYGQFDDRAPGADDGIATPVYVYDTDTGKSYFVLNRKYKMPIKVSPSGRYLSYFKDGDWWIFDAVTHHHSNITSELNFYAVNEEKERSGIKTTYGSPGWNKDETGILLYDKNDIWLLAPDGTKSQKLTNGRKENKTYRIIETERLNPRLVPYITNSFDLLKGISLTVHKATDHSTGFALLKKNKLSILMESKGYLSNLKGAKKGENFIYTEEDYNQPPVLKKYSSKTKKITEIFQSNPQHNNFKWGQSELVNYRLEDGTELKGALFYPSDFDNSRKYPMIVNIYQKLSSKVNRYQNPTLLTGFDLNISNFTTNGYFVFCPDIIYEINEPGPSALRCVTAGVGAVLKKGLIDRKHIGLFGHSLGGYETSYIISETDLFATAVSGAGTHDLISFYFSMAWLWQVPQSHRFINDIMFFGNTFFEIPEIYEKNSPINFVEDINTPLLTITGNKDTNVNWEQSVEMFNALRLLGKEHIMLIYENEGHEFFDPFVQKDYNHRLMDWYGHYLRGGAKKGWMKKK
ncbi:alpha/beta hydrolase family protein [Galbibacter sp.]|uniref:alpha/beta hydrolase family protein n=1 Tax=Galbibacter sp. TaxID=2918471 RepID=UPI003A8DDB51